MDYPLGFTNNLDIFAYTVADTNDASFAGTEGTWSILFTNLPTAGTNRTVCVDPGFTPNTFYAAGDATIDSDGDGQSDARELLVWDSIPGNSDTDGDGIPDAVEIQLGTDPLTATPLVENAEHINYKQQGARQDKFQGFPAFIQPGDTNVPAIPRYFLKDRSEGRWTYIDIGEPFCNNVTSTGYDEQEARLSPDAEFYRNVVYHKEEQVCDGCPSGQSCADCSGGATEGYVLVDLETNYLWRFDSSDAVREYQNTSGDFECDGSNTFTNELLQSMTNTTREIYPLFYASPWTITNVFSNAVLSLYTNTTSKSRVVWESLDCTESNCYEEIFVREDPFTTEKLTDRTQMALDLCLPFTNADPALAWGQKFTYTSAAPWVIDGGGSFITSAVPIASRSLSISQKLE